MITDKELNEVSLSPTKKDYYQIWNELIELASKISTRWSPDSTNESDPGIVLLKSLVAVADKLNYNIDKNTLEAFMPSATQMESMRKLTEMLGYSMKYYRSATCKVNIAYSKEADTSISTYDRIYFPKFVNLKNEEENVNYVTLEDFTLQESEPSRVIAAIEGELIECETNTDNIISIEHLDDNNRYLLPETNIAENGIFICNVYEVNGSSRESEYWKQADNLNTYVPGSCVFKFGYDSNEGLPYIQFPDDISQLIKDGIRIRYIRTNGLMGNIAARVLCKLEPPALWSADDSVKNLTANDFAVVNTVAAANGANPETINAAYNGYKKTIGTFDTLVTCRDYMNKIYQLTASDTDTTPLVSNVIVSDIRDDINRATTLCSFDEYGICYSDVSLPLSVDGVSHDAIEHFDLVLYPFKTIYGTNSKDEYVNSFKYDASNNGKIKRKLEQSKTIAHDFKDPNGDEIVCIKNYLKLKAKITTVKKVTVAEELEIKSNVFTAIYKNFNCRQIDFGEEIPYDTILEVLENADARIKDVSLDEPTLYTKFLLKSGNGEVDLVATDPSKPGERASLTDADRLYNKLVLRNVLAGRLAAFSYATDFKTSYAETAYGGDYEPTYPTSANNPIVEMTSKFEVVSAEHTPESGQDKALKLGPNEVIQFRRPNLKTTVTYPCYVNYYAKLKIVDANAKQAIPATFISLYDYLAQVDQNNPEDEQHNVRYIWVSLIEDPAIYNNISSPRLTKSDADAWLKTYEGLLFSADLTTWITSAESLSDEETEYKAFAITQSTFGALGNFIKGRTENGIELDGLYRTLGADLKSSYGFLIDANYVKYAKAYTHASLSRPLLNYFVQQTHAANSEEVQNKKATQDGKGQGDTYPSIKKGEDYELGKDEYLLINYTDSTTDDDSSDRKTIINKYYGEGTIICPNFELVDSELYHNNHTYTKTDGFSFDNASINGMFTLSSNEQICIRDFVSVKLDKYMTGIYWLRDDDDPSELTHEFTYDESYHSEDNQKNAYVLKDGEAFFCTDSKKQDMIYYGAGSLIVKSKDTPTFYKHDSDGVVSLDEIVDKGIDAIPWTFYDLRDETSKKQSVSIIENQYITLTEGDTLRYISEDSAGAEFSIDLPSVTSNSGG